MKPGRQNRRTQRKGKVTAKYQRLEGQKARTKKVQRGGGFFWTNNAEKIACYLAHECIKTVMTDIYTDKDKQQAYILTKQTLYDYLAAMIYRMYKLYKNEIINKYIKQAELNKLMDPQQLARLKPADIERIRKLKDIKLKEIFELPVKHNGKYDFGRKLYEKTNTSKQPSNNNITTEFIAITEFVKFLNSDTNNIKSLENIIHSQCQNTNRYQNNKSPAEKYIKPVLYKTDNNSIANALFGICNGNTLTSINIQNIIYSYILSAKQIITGINNKAFRKTDPYIKFSATFKETTRLLKNRVNIEQMASALFYYSMYKSFNPGQQSDYRYGGYSSLYGGYGGYGGYRGY